MLRGDQGRTILRVTLLRLIQEEKNKMPKMSQSTEVMREVGEEVEDAGEQESDALPSLQLRGDSLAPR